MLQRHEITPAGRRADRDWWFATKLAVVIVVALVAAYVVHVTLLGQP